LCGKLPPDIAKSVEGSTTYTQQYVDDLLAKLTPDQRNDYEATIRNITGIHNRVADRSMTLAEVDQLLVGMSDADKALIQSNLDQLQAARDRFNVLDAEVQKQELALAQVKPGLSQVV
jgi:hypothetical protein